MKLSLFSYGRAALFAAVAASGFADVARAEADAIGQSPTNAVPCRAMMLLREISDGFSALPQAAAVDPAVCRFGGEPTDPEGGETAEPDLAPPFVPVLAVGVCPSFQIGADDATVYGLGLSLPHANWAGVVGIEAGFVNDVGFLAGIQAGLVNLADEATGLQIGLFNEVDVLLGGAQIGVLNRAVHGATGLQVGLFNGVGNGTLRGVQIGLVNAASQLCGVQIGLLNGATTLVSGVQLGGVNMELNETRIVLPLVNATF